MYLRNNVEDEIYLPVFPHFLEKQPMKNNE